MKLIWCIAILVIGTLVRWLLDNFCEMTGSDRKWCNWSKSSESQLEVVEKKILSYLNASYEGKYVNIGDAVSQDDKIWTIIFNENVSDKYPLVMLHGLGAGVALWVSNLDQIVEGRKVYAIDLLGFGRSSRPEFSNDNTEIEAQMVAGFEAWRKAVGLEKFVLLGHSLGGYISTLYAMQHPERIQHLILVEPWGVSKTPDSIEAHYKLSFVARGILNALLPFNPLWPLRAFGPAGESFIRKMRKDLVRKLEPTVEEANDLIPQYIYQCNSRYPSGESAFHTLMHKFAFAKEPLISRFDKLDKSIPLTMVYGSKSWLDKSCLSTIKDMRTESYLNIEIMEECGHHVNLDKPGLFNELVVRACRHTD